ncbi:MAG: hypothetical protein HZB43_00870 [candidate division Zixibacteria bacterium]|nr:hypothetical protein [candidate division Zixibacteria bacterium]
MKRLLSLAVVIAMCAPVAALAGSGLSAWGPRVGIAANPDQINLGAQLDFGYLASHLRFQPNFEVGAGNNRTTASFNFDLAYVFLSRRSQWRPYLGGGVGLNIIDRHYPRRYPSESDLAAGMGFIGGIEKNIFAGNRFFTEVRIGFINSPDLKWTVGWCFKT